MVCNPRQRINQLLRMRWSHRGANAPGFTLLELLVVMMIFTILSSLALPVFLNQVVRARQTKALNAVGVMKRAQHSFFYEHSNFATSIAELGFGHLNTDGTYQYQVQSSGQSTIILAIPTDPNLRGYAGLAYLSRDSQGNAILSSLLCEGDLGDAPSPVLVSQGNQITTSGCNRL